MIIITEDCLYPLCNVNIKMSKMRNIHQDKNALLVINLYSDNSKIRTVIINVLMIIIGS